MCGIVGYFGTADQKKEAVFKDMLRVDVVRGKDSTGVLFANQGKTAIVKYPCLPEQLIETKAFSKAMQSVWDCYVGHNRWATSGDISVENSHPFKHDHIIGVHNGTLRGQWRLPDHKEFEVDSDNIFYAIAKEGIAATWEKIDGAASLVWWDKNDKSLNLLRNADRPMCFARTSDGKGIFFASEPWIIIAMCLRNGVEVEKVYSTEVDKQYHFYHDTKSKPEVIIEHTKRNPWRPTVTTHTFGNNNNIKEPWESWETVIDGDEPGATDLALINKGDTSALGKDFVWAWDVEKKELTIVDMTKIPVGYELKRNDVTRKLELVKTTLPLPLSQDGGAQSNGPSPSETVTPTTNIPPSGEKKKASTVNIVHGRGPQIPAGKKGTFNIFPLSVQEVYKKDGKTLDKYRVECRFQQNRSQKAFIFIQPDDKCGILDFCPTYGRHFNKVYFRLPLDPILSGHGQVASYFGKAEDIEIIVPSDAVRDVGQGKTYNREDFDKHFRNCEWCLDPLDFNDVDIVFSDRGDKAICGDCNHNLQTDTGNGMSIHDVRQLLEA